MAAATHRRGKSVPIKFSGGMQRGGTFELEGTLDLHFNARRDRIVVDTNFTLKTTFPVIASFSINSRANFEAASFTI